MSFLSVDATLIVQLVNFAIFFALLNVVFLKPVGRAIAKRRAYIDGLVADYDRYQEEGNALRAQAEAIRAEARREAEQTLAATRAAASNEAAEISSRYGAQAKSTIDAARSAAAAELEKARGREGEAMRGLAEIMLERVVPDAAR